MSQIEPQIRAFAQRFEKALDGALARLETAGPGVPPERLLAAMRHGSLNGGKRLRPYLLTQTAALFDVPESVSMQAAVAVEFIQCYSLIHDDLPAMDDDDLRRGKPTVHMAYDEATAILAGDTLLTHAFGLLADPATHPDADMRTRLITELATGSGIGGMAGGQMRDLEGEKGGFTDTDIATMQAMKTGALIRASVRMGALLGGADDNALSLLTRYAEKAGRAFQLADDLLDLTASTEQMGKATQKDGAKHKPTLVSRIGEDAARRHLAETVHAALSALTPFEDRAKPLRDLAIFFAERQQ